MSHPLTSTDDPEHWLAREAEARACADHLFDPEAKAGMLSVADSYKHLAYCALGRLRAAAERELRATKRP